jgi:hypothetical protein
VFSSLTITLRNWTRRNYASMYVVFVPKPYPPEALIAKIGVRLDKIAN